MKSAWHFPAWITEQGNVLVHKFLWIEKWRNLLYTEWVINLKIIRINNGQGHIYLPTVPSPWNNCRSGKKPSRRHNEEKMEDGPSHCGVAPRPLRISCWVASTSLPHMPFGKMVGHLLLQTGIEIPPKAYRDPSPSQSFFPLPKLTDPSQVPRLRNCWEPPFPICNIKLEG